MKCRLNNSFVLSSHFTYGRTWQNADIHITIAKKKKGKSNSTYGHVEMKLGKSLLEFVQLSSRGQCSSADLPCKLWHKHRTTVEPAYDVQYYWRPDGTFYPLIKYCMHLILISNKAITYIWMIRSVLQGRIFSIFFHEQRGQIQNCKWALNT